MNKKFYLNVALIIVLWTQFIFVATNLVCEYINDFILMYSRSLWASFVVSNLFDLLFTFIGAKVVFNHFNKNELYSTNLKNKLVYSIVAVICLHIVYLVLSEFGLFFKSEIPRYNTEFYLIRVYINKLIYFLELLIFILVFYKKINWRNNENTLDSNF